MRLNRLLLTTAVIGVPNPDADDQRSAGRCEQDEKGRGVQEVQHNSHSNSANERWEGEIASSVWLPLPALFEGEFWIWPSLSLPNQGGRRPIDRRPCISWPEAI
jgi:hypothetical protein